MDFQGKRRGFAIAHHRGNPEPQTLQTLNARYLSVSGGKMTAARDGKK